MNDEREKFIPEKERIAGYVVLTLELHQVRGGRRWTGRCLETGTATFNDSIDLLTEEISSLTVLQLCAVDKVNQRDRYLQDRRIIFHSQLPQTYEPKLPINSTAYYRVLILANILGQEESWFSFKPKAE